MPDYDENGNEIEAEPEPEGMQGLRGAKKAAEQRAQVAEEALEAANADRRELAAMKAGLNPDDKTAAFFLKHYDGPLDAETMKTAAVEAGVLPEVDAAAAQSVQGQAQMASAVQGGERSPLGTTFVGQGAARHEVPAEEAEMWQDIEKAVSSGSPQSFQKVADILRQHGHDVGVGQTEPLHTSPNTVPLANQANRIV